jgi:hypothetical protein
MFVFIALDVCLVSWKCSSENVYIALIVRGSSLIVLIAFFQSYVEHDLRKNKIVIVFTTGFFRH